MSIIDNLDTLKDLITFIKKNKIDSIEIEGIIIKNSYHFEPESPEQTKARLEHEERNRQELIGWASR